MPSEKKVREWIALCAAFLNQDIGRLWGMELLELARWAGEARALARARRHRRV